MKRFQRGSTFVVIGPGGVGKTTIAAALGIATASAGLTSGVITVDPTRRLRDALGLGRLSARPTRFDPKRLALAGLDPRLSLSAMTLDTREVWDELVARFVSDPARRRTILRNSFYLNFTRNFSGAENYAALERLQQLNEVHAFEATIVDTPPAMQTFDFIEGPSRLVALLESKPARQLFRLMDTANRPSLRFGDRLARIVIGQLERFAGNRPLSTIAEFFAASAESIDGITERMRSTERLLRSRSLEFVLVTTAEAARLREADDILKVIAKAGLRVSAIVVNRACNQTIFEELLRSSGKNKPWRLDWPALGSSISNDRSPGMSALLKFFEQYAAEQRDQLARIASFASELPSETKLMLVPELDTSMRELKSLAAIAAILTEPQARRIRFERGTAIGA